MEWRSVRESNPPLPIDSRESAPADLQTLVGQEGFEPSPDASKAPMLPSYTKAPWWTEISLEYIHYMIFVLYMFFLYGR